MDHHPKEAWIAEPATLGTAELDLMARSMLTARRALHGPLPSALIPDTSLELLLSLFIAGNAGTSLSQTALAGRTTAPESVALRWITVLIQHGFASLNNDGVALTTSGVEAIKQTLLAVAASQWKLDDAG